MQSVSDSINPDITPSATEGDLGAGPVTFDELAAAEALAPGAQPIPPPLRPGWIISGLQGPMLMRPVPAASVHPREPRPLIWPAVVITFCAVPATLVVAVFVGIVMAIIMLSSSTQPTGEADIQAMVERMLESPTTLVAIIVPTQLMMGLTAGLGAALTRRPWRETLGVGRPRASVLTLLLLLLATAAIHLGLSGAVRWILPESIEELLAEGDFLAAALDHGNTAWRLILIASLSVLPGIFEEMLFRGYLQRRLLMWWPPLGAIALASTIFAIFHIAPIQAVTVFPLGLWFGFVAWRTGSIWPAAACHFTNNALAFALHLYGDVTWPDDAASRASLAAALVLGLLAAPASIVLLMRRPAPAVFTPRYDLVA
jgi:membrane protease YdiL (CAAX protease family)